MAVDYIKAAGLTQEGMEDIIRAVNRGEALANPEAAALLQLAVTCLGFNQELERKAAQVAIANEILRKRAAEWRQDFRAVARMRKTLGAMCENLGLRRIYDPFLPKRLEPEAGLTVEEFFGIDPRTGRRAKDEAAIYEGP